MMIRHRRPRRLWQMGWTAVCIFSAGVQAAVATAFCESQIATAAKRYDIPLAVFYAVGLTETGGKNGLQPYALNIDGRASVNGSLEQGLAAFETARRGGARLIDVGCMQINYRWHGEHFSSITEMFDPAHNVDYAARFLRELRTRERSWTLAVARYNAGPNNNPAQKKYVCGVIGKMVKSGFGAWTENARTFCGEPHARLSRSPVHASLTQGRSFTVRSD